MADDQVESSKARLNHLDVYKGIAILFVIITHYLWTDKQRLLFLFPFWIDMAVPVFMVITGYLSSMSFNRKPFTLITAYNPRAIMAKWMRFVIPFLPVFFLQIAARLLVKQESISIIDFVKCLTGGGEGPGSYYFPVMIQVVVLIPLIWIIVKKFNFKGLAICFVANIVFEVLKTIVNMNPSLYRICALRYLFILAYGCFLNLNVDRIKNTLPYWIAGICGVAYIIVFNYTSLEPVFTNQWITTSVFAVLYLVPLMMKLIQQTQIHNRLLQRLGEASYEIYLVQMLYYWSVAEKTYEWIQPVVLRVAFNIVVCCVAGVIFYKIENPITRKVVKAIRG